MDLSWLSNSYFWTSTLLTLATLGVLAQVVFSGRETTQREILCLAGLAAAMWWTVAGHGNSECAAKFAAASLAAFSVGTVAGFLFSSYSDEKESVGKVRDWLIGGITAITIAEAASGAGDVKTVLQFFVPKGCPDDFGIVLGMVIVFFTGGYFLMFFNRELILNVLLAKSRAMRRSIEEKGTAASQRLVEVVARRAGRKNGK